MLFRTFSLALSVLALVSFNVAMATDCPNAAYSKFNSKDMVKGDTIDGASPAPGVKFLTPEEASKHFGNPNFVFIDTRPEDMHKECSIKNSENIPYTFGENEALKKRVTEITASGKNVIFYCNSMKCYRSLNASIQSACSWKVDASKIFWFGKGTMGMAQVNKAALQGDLTKCDPLQILIKGTEKKSE